MTLSSLLRRITAPVRDLIGPEPDLLAMIDELFTMPLVHADGIPSVSRDQMAAAVAGISALNAERAEHFERSRQAVAHQAARGPRWPLFDAVNNRFVDASGNTVPPPDGIRLGAGRK
jgi:hypothetical protein